MTLSKEAARLVALFRQYHPENPRKAAGVARALLAAAPSAQRAHEDECGDSTYQGSSREARHERRMTALVALVNDLNTGRPETETERFVFEENGDPRGFPFYVHFPGRKESNSWGGKERGFGVYCEDDEHRAARLARPAPVRAKKWWAA